MRLLVVAALAAVALPTASQPADGGIGVYAVVGSGAPERGLFPSRSDPSLALGWRFSERFDVHAGVRLRTTATVVGPSRFSPMPGIAEQRREDQTRAAVVSASLTTPIGPLEGRSRVSVSYDVRDLTYVTRRYDSSDDTVPFYELPVDSESQTGTFVHTGASAILAVPIQKEHGRLAPGIGGAISVSNQVRGTLGTSPSQWVAFVNLPTSLAVGPTWITLEASIGMSDRFDGLTPMAPFVDGGLRVDL